MAYKNTKKKKKNHTNKKLVTKMEVKIFFVVKQ